MLEEMEKERIERFIKKILKMMKKHTTVLFFFGLR